MTPIRTLTSERPDRTVIGLLPAAGYASRLGASPVSKEVYPLGADGARVRVPVDGLLRAMARAGAARAYMVLREGKWDVPAFLGSAPPDGPPLAYLVTPPTPGVPHTADVARPFLDGATVLFGFPDVLFEPEDAFTPLLEALRATGAVCALGGFPARDPQKVDMIKAGPDGRLQDLIIKPDGPTGLTHTWLLAAWTPEFTDFLHTCVRQDADAHRLHHLGHVLQRALAAGLPLTTVRYPHARYLDVGTHDALQQVHTLIPQAS